nr:hypothetical protein [Tanacetum cinerariifolium]
RYFIAAKWPRRHWNGVHSTADLRKVHGCEKMTETCTFHPSHWNSGQSIGATRLRLCSFDRSLNSEDACKVSERWHQRCALEGCRFTN